MTPEEQAACLEFAKTFGWPEWNITYKDYTKHEDVKKESLRGDSTAWEIFDFIDGKWNVCGRTVFNSVARALWIVWLLEEAGKIGELTFLHHHLEFNHARIEKWGPARMWETQPEKHWRKTILLALLDAVTQAKRQEVKK